MQTTETNDSAKTTIPAQLESRPDHSHWMAGLSLLASWVALAIALATMQSVEDYVDAIMNPPGNPGLSAEDDTITAWTPAPPLIRPPGAPARRSPHHSLTSDR